MIDGRNDMVKAPPTPWRAPPIVGFVEKSVAERTGAQELRSQIAINGSRWEQLADEIFRNHRGRFVCISGGQLYSADAPEEVLRMARSQHPDDNGRIIRFIPTEKKARV